MAYPTFDTDGSLTDKFLQLIDFSEDSWAMTAIETAVVTGDNYGWMGIATHVEGNAVAAPGGFATNAAPVVLVAGDDGTNAVPLQIGAGNESVALRVTIATDSTGTLTIDNPGLTELAAAINSSKLDVNLAASTVDVMLGTDFSAVLGTGSLVTTTQADNLANTLDGLNTTTFNYVYDGTTWDRMLGNSTDGVLVNLGTNNDVVATNAGAFVVQEDGAALTALQLIGTAAHAEDAASANAHFGMAAMVIRDDVLAANAGVNADGDYTFLRVDNNGALYCNIQDGGNTITVDGTIIASDTAGDKAHDAADGGNPLKIGGRAQEPTAQPDEVADEDRVDALFDRNGYLHVRGDFNPLNAAINASTSGNNTIVAAAGVGKRIAVWAWDLISDGTVDARWEDDANGASGTFSGQYPFQAREGIARSAGGLVPLFIGTANKLLNLELSAAINVHGSLAYTVIDD